jgi:hypothetical protein
MLEKSSQYKCTILHDKYNGTNVPITHVLKS